MTRHARDVTGWLGSAVVVAAALVIARVLALGELSRPWRFASWLGTHGSPVHAVIAGWLVAAPVVLLMAAALRRRTPWPWAGATLLFLLAITVAVARFPHLVPTRGWVLLAALLVAALTSVITAFPAEDDQSASQSA